MFCLHTWYDHAVEQVRNEVTPLGHGSRYDGGRCRSEYVLEEPKAALTFRHANAREVFFAVKTAASAAVRQPEADQPVRNRTENLKPIMQFRNVMHAII